MDEDEAATSGNHTVCPLCGGAGVVSDPKYAVIAGTARTIDNGRPCRGCEGNGYRSGLIPPV
ncbi:MAG: hypothetical protein GEU98_21995 [Pseudonocardiaceae bacterium]|nr:hypothetical protein [Pseudonocardiaceae bacterium]